MVFSGVFANLKSEEIAALLSCFVFQEKAPMPKMAENLSGCLRQIHVICFLFIFYEDYGYGFQEHAKKIAKVSIECKLEMNEEEYVDSFKPGLMEVRDCFFRFDFLSVLVMGMSIYCFYGDICIYCLRNDFNFHGPFQVVHQWASDKTFAEITKNTEIFEGMFSFCFLKFVL